MENESLLLGESPIPTIAYCSEQSPATLDQLTTQVELYRFLAESRDITAMIRRVSTMLMRAGFSDFSHALLNEKEDSRDPVGTGKKRLQAVYYGEEFYLHDLMLHHAMLSDEPILQSDVNAHVNAAPYSNDLFRRNRELYDVMKSFGVYEYYNIPFRSYCGRGRALFSVGTSIADPGAARALMERYRPELAVLARALDQVGSIKFSSHFHNAKSNKEKIIQSAPLRLLNVLANENCTLNEAAERVHISISTANQHVAAAKKALGANTIASAVVQAIRLGLITVE